MDIPRLDRPIREPFDLGAFSKEYAGQTVNLLINPTGRFKKGYIDAAWAASLGMESEAFAAFIEAVIGARGNTDDLLDGIAEDVIRWLFLYSFYDFDGEKFQTVVRPHILIVWDEAKDRRVKAHAAPPSVLRRPENAAQPQKQNSPTESPHSS